VEPDDVNGDEPRTDAPSGAAEQDRRDQQQEPPMAAACPETSPSETSTSQAAEPAKVGAVRSLWVLLRRLVAGPAESPSAAVAKRPQPDHLKDCLAMLDARPGLRTTTLRLLGPQAVEEGASFVHEHVETQDEHGNARQTDLYIAYRCSNNHWIDQNVRVQGTCFCGAILCSTPGCFAICQNQSCSAACCPRHRKTVLLDGIATTYCTRCFLKKYWFW
jgi:hypothetical protein